MADEDAVIPSDRLKAGLAILELTDKYGFDAHAAAWIYDKPSRVWRYLLVTPMLKSKGPSWIYARLSKLFRNHPLPQGISPLDIFVIDSDYELALISHPVFAPGVTVGPKDNPENLEVHFLVTANLRFEEFQVSDGFIAFLRRLSPAERKRHRNPATSFDQRVSRLAA